MTLYLLGLFTPIIIVAVIIGLLWVYSRMIP
jgi:heme/copper-type cytochrome/quinol oxidase subunit 4